MKENKISIIIPTRERCDTLYSTILTCLNQNYSNYSIIICDNASKDDTSQVVHSFNNSLIKYYKSEIRLSMSQNFDYGLSLVDDGYIMFIGDDDGLLPNTLNYINCIINKEKVDAVMSYNAFYTWPETDNPNTLSWGKRKGYTIRYSKEWIKKYLKFEMQYTFDLPSAYCGIVNCRILKEKSNEGVFFKSQTPDAYSAFAVAYSIDRYAYSYTPFIIHGASKRSNGAAFLSKKKGNEGVEAELFFKENTIPFHKELVLSKSFRICSLEAFLQFRDNFPHLVDINSIDWKCFLRNVLKERNENNYKEVTNSVHEMCLMHNVDFHDLLVNDIPQEIKKVKKRNKLKRVVRNFFCKRIDEKEYEIKTSIRDTAKIGIKNINDAVLVLRYILRNDFIL